MNIAVCIKPVPDSEHYDKITIDPKTKRVNREGIDTVINSMDKNAIEAALALKESHGGHISIFTMAPDSAVETLRKALAMGADDAYLISDREFGGADTWATSYTLAKAIEKAGSFDVILLGNQTEDGGTAQVPSQLGEWLTIPHLVNVKHLEYTDGAMMVETKTENGKINFKVKLPALFGVLKDINEPRIPNVMNILKAKNKTLTTYRAGDLNENKSWIGLVGSPTQPGDIFEPDMKRKAEVIDGTLEEIAQKVVAAVKKAGIEV